MIDKYTEKMMIALSKAGKAPLVFTVAKHPGDNKFDKDQLHIDLYIIPFLDEF